MQTSSVSTNPYASPRILEVEAPKQKSVTKQKKRASERELCRLCTRLAVADVTYVAGCVTFIAAFFINLDNEMRIAASYLPYGFFAVTWVCTFSIRRLTEGIGGAIAGVVLFPVPMFGSLVFLSGSERANTFLRHNGYRRTFLGGKPNPMERQQMAIDENYSPSDRFDHQGNRYSRFDFTLASSFLFLLLACWVIGMLVLIWN